MAACYGNVHEYHHVGTPVGERAEASYDNMTKLDALEPVHPRGDFKYERGATKDTEQQLSSFAKLVHVVTSSLCKISSLRAQLTATRVATWARGVTNSKSDG